MKREGKKPSRRASGKPAGKSAKQNMTRISGGATVKGQHVGIGGDVVGRDKLVAGDDIIQAGQYVERQTNINLPRSAQIAIGVAAIAIVVMAIVVITRPQTIVVNGSFETGTTEGWVSSGPIEVVATNEQAGSTISRYAAQFGVGASVEQTVTVSIETPLLTIAYRSPDGSARGTLNILLNDNIVLSVTRPGQDTAWQTLTYGMDAYAGQQVRLRIEYVAELGRAGRLLHPPAQRLADSVWVTSIQITSARGPTASLPLTPIAAPATQAPVRPLSLNVVENDKPCQDSAYFTIDFTLTAQGGAPPYTYFHDISEIGGPARGPITYQLRWGETSAANGTFAVVDSAGNRAEEKFFSTALECP